VVRRAPHVHHPSADRDAPVGDHPSDRALRALRARASGGVIPVTVVSYNIHRGVGLDRRRNLDRTADVIAETAPDVVGLQEVIREAGGAAGDQVAYLAAALGMERVMGETRAHGTGTYGNAVL